MIKPEKNSTQVLIYFLELRFLLIILFFFLLDVVMIGAYHDQLAHGLMTQFPDTSYTADEWNNRGVAFSTIAFTKSIPAFDQALMIDPDNATYWNNKGVTLDYFHYYEEAYEAFNQATRIDPDNATYWNNKGITFIHLKIYGEAFRAFDRALKINPDYIQALMNKAEVIYLGNLSHDADQQRYSHEYHDSLSAYYKISDTSPNYTGAWDLYTRGKELYLKTSSTTKVYEDALNAYFQAVLLDPDNKDAWRTKGEAIYRQVREAEESTVYPDPLELYDQIIKIDPENASTWYYTKGEMIYHWQNHDTDALEAYNQSVKINPENAEAWYGLGKTYKALGMKNESDEAYARALQIDPETGNTSWLGYSLGYHVNPRNDREACYIVF